ARLCLEVLRSAALHGARVVNHVAVTAFERGGGRLTGVRAADRLGGTEVRVRAKVLLNAAGPWADEVRRLAGETGRRRLAPRRGFPGGAPGRGVRPRSLPLPPRAGAFFFSTPWRAKTLTAPPDTEWPGAPDACRAEPDAAPSLRGAHTPPFDPPLTP